MEVADVAYAAFDKLPLPRDCHVEKDADTNGGYRSKSNVDISTFQQQISNWVQFQFLKMTKVCWKAVRCSQQGCDDNGKRNTKLVFHTWRQFVLHSDNPTGFDTRPRCTWGRFFQREPSGNSWIKADKDFFWKKASDASNVWRREVSFGPWPRIPFINLLYAPTVGNHVDCRWCRTKVKGVAVETHETPQGQDYKVTTHGLRPTTKYDQWPHIHTDQWPHMDWVWPQSVFFVTGLTSNQLICDKSCINLMTVNVVIKKYVTLVVFPELCINLRYWFTWREWECTRHLSYLVSVGWPPTTGWPLCAHGVVGGDHQRSLTTVAPYVALHEDLHCKKPAEAALCFALAYSQVSGLKYKQRLVNLASSSTILTITIIEVIGKDCTPKNVLFHISRS